MLGFFKKSYLTNRREIFTSDNLKEFNTSSELKYVRELYKNNFDFIKMIIHKHGYGLAIDDIAKLDLKCHQVIENNRYLIKKINKKIYFKRISLQDIQ